MGNYRTTYDSDILKPLNVYLGLWRHHFLLALFLVLSLICNVLKTEDPKSGNALDLNWMKHLTNFKTAHTSRNKTDSREGQIQVNMSCILSMGCFSLKIESPDCQDGVLKDNLKKNLKIETAVTTHQCLSTPSIIVRWILDSSVAKGQEVKRCMYSLACIIPRRLLISTNGVLRWIEISVATSEAAKGSIFTTIKSPKQDEVNDTKQSLGFNPVVRNSIFIYKSAIIKNNPKKNAYSQERIWIHLANEMPKVHNHGNRKHEQNVKSGNEISHMKETQVKNSSPSKNESHRSLRLSGNGQTLSHALVTESDILKNEVFQNVTGTSFVSQAAASPLNKVGGGTSSSHNLSIFFQNIRMRSKQEANVTGGNNLALLDKEIPGNKTETSNMVNSNGSLPQIVNTPVNITNHTKSQENVEHGLESIITSKLREKGEDLSKPESINAKSMIQTVAVPKQSGLLFHHVPEPPFMPALRIGKSVNYPRKRYVWSQWGAWSRCSVSCGEGSEERARMCIDAGHSQYIKTQLKHCSTGPSSQRRLCTRTCVMPMAAGAAAAGVGGAAVATGQVLANDNEEWDDDDNDVVNVDDSDSASLTGPAAVAGAAGAAGVVAAGSGPVVVEQGGSSGPIISQDDEEEEIQDKLTAETIFFIIILVVSLLLFLISFCIWMCFSPPVPSVP